MSNNNKKYANISSSLRFPGNTLEICLDKIKILFEKNSSNIMSTEAIIKDLECSLKSSTTHTLIASLKYYNLLIKADDSNFKISDDIYDYCISNNLTKEVLINSLYSVPINKKIFSKFDFYNLPSENTIKSFLVKECKYNLKQADNYILTFNKNKNFYDNLINNKQETLNLDNISSKENKEEEIQKDIQTEEVQKIININNKAIIQYPLSNNKTLIINLPTDFKNLSIEDLEDIKDILELTIKKINKLLE